MAITTPTEYGGYEYNFVNDPPDRCICKICQLPSRDAYMTGQCCQGLTICKSCLDHWQKTPRGRKCPVCRKRNNNFNKNYPIEREIKCLYIYCTNKEKGCNWKGELTNINNHLGNTSGCQFEEVECSNECGKIMQRQYLASHVETECPHRMVNCQYCHNTGEYQIIEGQHKEECPRFPLPCPNKCEVGSVPRKDMKAHKKECPLEMIRCEYYSVGCKRVKLARKDFEKHDEQNMKEHLKMTKNKLADTTAQLDAALQQINSLTAMVNTHLYPFQLDAMVTKSKCVCPVTIKMTEYEDKKENIKEWFSNPFFTHNKGYSMCFCIDAAGNSDGKGTHLSVYLYLMKGPYDDNLTWPLKESFEIKLLNQISDSEHHSKILTYDVNKLDDYNSRVIEGNRSKRGWGCHQYICNEDLNKITSTCQFLKNDCLYLQVAKL